MPSYANYFVKFLQGYEAEGVPVQAVTVQNEVDTDQDGRMPACAWPQEYEADFVRGQLGPAFERSGVKTKIWIIDHNYNLWGRAMGELETPDVRKYTNAIAWHGYVGQPEWINRVQSAYPDVEMYWTEGGPDIKAPDYQTDFTNWAYQFNAIVNNWARSITAWNIALDEKGKKSYDEAASASGSGAPEGVAAIRLHGSGVDVRWTSPLGRRFTELAMAVIMVVLGELGLVLVGMTAVSNSDRYPELVRLRNLLLRFPKSPSIREPEFLALLTGPPGLDLDRVGCP